MKKMNLIRKTNELVNNYDPMDLLSLGAPDNEYSDESLKVAVAYSNSKTINDFKKKFVLIFANSFGLKSSSGKYLDLEKIAGAIYSELNG